MTCFLVGYMLFILFFSLSLLCIPNVVCLCLDNLAYFFATVGSSFCVCRAMFCSVWIFLLLQNFVMLHVKSTFADFIIAFCGCMSVFQVFMSLPTFCILFVVFFCHEIVETVFQFGYILVLGLWSFLGVWSSFYPFPLAFFFFLWYK